MADKYIIPVPEMLGGITPQPGLSGQMPLVDRMLDCRVLQGQIERVGFTSLGSSVVADPLDSWLECFEGSLYYLDGVDGYVWLDKELLYNVGTAGTLIHRNLTTTGYTLVAGKLRGFNGGAVSMNYPDNGAIHIMFPGLVPSVSLIGTIPDGIVADTDVSDAHPKGGALFSLDGINEVYEVIPHADGFLGGGDTGVVYYELHGSGSITSSSKQTRLSRGGLLSQRAMAGDQTIGFFVAGNRNLYVVQEGKLQELGYAHKFAGYNRAWLSYVPETQDLFILMDTNSSGELGTTECFLFNQGLTQLSIDVVSAKFIPGVGLVLLDTDGDTWTMNEPLTGALVDYDWSTWDFGYVYEDPGTVGDIVTTWGDFGTQLEKKCAGVELVGSPLHPVGVVVNGWEPNANDYGVEANIITALMPVSEFTLVGTRHRFNFHLPTYAEAGAYRITAFRFHMDSEALRGIYAAHESEEVSNQ